MGVKLLTEQHLEFLSLKAGCTGSSESTLVKMSYCLKLHVAAHIYPLSALATYWEFSHIWGLDITKHNMFSVVERCTLENYAKSCDVFVVCRLNLQTVWDQIRPD